MKRFVLGELFDFSNGVNAGKDAYGSGVPFANVLEVITNEGLRVTDIPGRIALTQKLIHRYSVRRGDVLFNRSSETQEEVGLSSTYLDDAQVVFGGFVLRGRPTTSALDVEYSQYALRASEIRAQIVARGQGGIRANIGQRDLATVSIQLPEVDVQRVIARRLDDAQALVRALERLMVKKRQVRKGMLQTLLTGRMRLPGFSKPWRPVTLGAHVTYVKSVALSRAQLDSSSPLRYLHYGDIHTHQASVLDASTEELPRASKGLARNAGLLQVGDLVFADASEDPDGVGRSVEVIAVPSGGVVPGLHTVRQGCARRWLQGISAVHPGVQDSAFGARCWNKSSRNNSGVHLSL